MLSSFGTSSCLFTHKPHSHLTVTEVFFSSLWTLNFNAFPTLKQILLTTRGVRLGGSGSVHNFTLSASQSSLPLFPSFPLSLSVSLLLVFRLSVLQ